MSGTTGVSGFGKRACRTRRNNLIPNDEANRNAPAECFRSHLVTLDKMLHSPVHPPNQNNTDVTFAPISEDTIETFEVFKVSPITPDQLSITTTPFVLQNGRQIDVNVVPCNQENLNAMRVSILVNHRIPNYVLVTDTVLIERNLPKYKEQINTHRVSTSLVLKIFTDTRLLYRWLPVKLVAYAPEALRWSDSTGDSRFIRNVWDDVATVKARAFNPNSFSQFMLICLVVRMVNLAHAHFSLRLALLIIVEAYAFRRNLVDARAIASLDIMDTTQRYFRYIYNAITETVCESCIYSKLLNLRHGAARLSQVLIFTILI